MADTSLFGLQLKSVEDVRDDILRVFRVGCSVRLGIDVSVSPDTEIYQRASAIASQIVVAMSNTAIQADQDMPDTATGAGLDRWGDVLQLTRNKAVGSEGQVIVSSTTTIVVATGTQLVDSAGLFYEVTVGGTFANGDTIAIDAVSTGSGTNLAEGTLLRWISIPAFSAGTAAVGTGGLTGGADVEPDEPFRARILSRLANPPGSGNAAQLAAFAEASTANVQKAFVYPAVEGPATAHFAVTRAPTTSDKNRDLNTLTLNTVVIPYVEGLMPEHAYILGTTVANTPADIAFGLSLPPSPFSVPPGPGGGWVDATPWPTQASTGYCDVTGVTSDIIFAVNADNAPIAKVTQISWLSPLTWTVYTAKVIAVSGAGPWTITIDSPFTGIATGNYIWPRATNQQNYIDAILASFAQLGPGEKTTNPLILPRGLRRPLPSQSWPAALTSFILRALSNTGSEVLDASYLYRSVSAPYAPAAPGAVSDPPNIFVPHFIGLYPTQ